jgi:dienelactone hydrolase
MKRLFCCSLLAAWLWHPALSCAQEGPLPGTTELTLSGDIASNLVAGVDRFLLRKIDESVTNRAQFWHRDITSPEAYSQSIETNRQRLAHILGVRDPRPSQVEMRLVASTTCPALVGHGSGFDVWSVCWPAFGDVHGEGLLLVPIGRAPVADVIAIPDAGQTPEQLAGLSGGIDAGSQFARRLAESGCRVVIPVLINTDDMGPGATLIDVQDGHQIQREGFLSSREFTYRPAFELGRHIIGYEIEKILAAVDWMAAGSNSEGNGSARVGTTGGAKIGIIGWGEGGLLAFYAGALDTRLSAVCVSGYFDDRRDIWQQPMYRNVFGLLEQFGDAEVAAMIVPRSLVVEAARGPEVTFAEGGAGAPGRLVTPSLVNVRSEWERARGLVAGLNPAPDLELVATEDGRGPFGSERALTAFLSALGSKAGLASPGPAPQDLRANFDPSERQAAQMHELDRHSQWLLGESPYVRQKFMAKLDTKTPETFRQSAEGYREFFYRDVIGRFDEPLLPPNPRSRKVYDEPKWTGYEVVLDVFPDVIAYGILLLPKDLKAGEQRPVVVCQHGLEGRPEYTVKSDSEYHYYKNFAAKLCERGFITFAPQNLYIFHDRFRTLQRKANPLGKTLYSVIVPQHQQITDWLKTLPFVDPARIGFYGLSYGGKTAMRVPALVTNYCLSICSGDFNDWIGKNASTRSPYSYVLVNQYEIFEFDLGSTFSYAEMAALIAPRPFMVERGHLDGVAPDETVASEFAKVRYLYEARLGLRDQCAIEWFTGPHTIHGQGTFAFLHEHLNWPAPHELSP